MNPQTPAKKRFYWRELVWLGGAEGAALGAVLMAIPFIATRLITLYRARA